MKHPNINDESYTNRELYMLIEQLRQSMQEFHETTNKQLAELPKSRDEFRKVVGGAVDVGVTAAKRARYGDIALLHTRNQPAIPQIKQEESWDMTITSQILPYFAGEGIDCVTLSTLYDDLLREEHSAAGCEIGIGLSSKRLCLD